MNHSLEQAYRNALYVVFYQERQLYLKVDKSSLWLDELLILKNVTSAAFITAYNPQSQIQDDSTNKCNQLKLERLIQAQDYFYLSGYSSDKKTVWPQEQSFLILGIQLKNATQLAKSFEQLAFLWMEVKQPIKLIDLSAFH